MDRELLKRYLDQGMSLDSIAEASGKHPSTISYWLRKHGLRANGAAKHSPRGSLSKQQLRPLVEQGLPVREIARRLGRSQRSVRYWIEQHCLPSPIQVRRGERDQRLGAGQRTLFKQCGEHGWTTFVIENSGRTRCRKCRQARVAEWRRRAKLRLVEEAGGCCAACGYDGWPGALEFHHLDPEEKSFGLSAHGLSRSFEVLRAEAAKCVLLCANCHAEVEGGFRSLPVK
ncbi:MAG TPA: helix-turn-helix domain-containing protein [Solirubrobacterales bacterium]|nr:helix-turn-helix domain-containing protein [Solirubrobacterales bacterium]